MKIQPCIRYKFPLMFLVLISVLVLSAQELQDSAWVSPIEGLEKGNFYLSAGFNFNELVSNNNDEFIFYILDDSSTRYNVKLGSGYMVEDMRSVGVGFRYFYDKYEVTYENAVGDTIRSTSRSTKAIGNIFYGISKPIFDSKRVFIISDPSLFFGVGNNEGSRTLDGSMENSTSRSYELSIGLNVGLQVFLTPKLSFQVTVGPVGVGYRWEEFTLDGDPNGDTQSFFARMSPDLYNFDFTISRFF